MTINEVMEENVKVILVTGKVDSVSSGDLQKYMLNSYVSCNDIIMDFAEVDYVSSAGLRVFLMAQKTAQSKGGSFALRNVGPAVMNIIKTVGMDKMLNII